MKYSLSARVYQHDSANEQPLTVYILQNNILTPLVLSKFPIMLRQSITGLTQKIFRPGIAYMYVSGKW